MGARLRATLGTIKSWHNISPRIQPGRYVLWYTWDRNCCASAMLTASAEAIVLALSISKSEVCSCASIVAPAGMARQGGAIIRALASGQLLM